MTPEHFTLFAKGDSYFGKHYFGVLVSFEGCFSGLFLVQPPPLPKKRKGPQKDGHETTSFWKEVDKVGAKDYPVGGLIVTYPAFGKEHHRLKIAFFRGIC